MSHEAAKQEHLKETIQDGSRREESVSRQPSKQLLLLGGRRENRAKKLPGYADDRGSSEGQVADEEQEEVGGTGRWGRLSEETTTFTTSCRSEGG